MLKHRLAFKAVDLPHFYRHSSQHRTTEETNAKADQKPCLINLLNLLQKTVSNNSRLEGRAALWRALDRQEKDADRNLMIFNKVRRGLIHWRWNKPIQQ